MSTSVSLSTLPVAFDLGLDESADHVVAGFGTKLLYQVVVVDPGLRRRFETLCSGSNFTGMTFEQQIEPEPDLIAILLRYTQHGGDDLVRKQGREVGDHIEGGWVKHVDAFVNLLAHHVFQTRRSRAG